VVTQATNIEACHIFPFSAANKPDITREVLQNGCAILGIERMKIVAQILEEKLDTTQNMIALEPGLHKMWSDSMWALEPYQQLEDGMAWL